MARRYLAVGKCVRGKERWFLLMTGGRSLFADRRSEWSPSPTYRLHVCDVDNERRGFGGRLGQSSGRVRSPSADHVIQDDVVRPYSPSFGRNRQDRRANDQPFVILDNASKNRSGRSSDRRRRTDRNVDVPVPVSRGRPKTPSRWMPPWYDNTNTI